MEGVADCMASIQFDWVEGCIGLDVCFCVGWCQSSYIYIFNVRSLYLSIPASTLLCQPRWVERYNAAVKYSAGHTARTAHASFDATDVKWEHTGVLGYVLHSHIDFFAWCPPINA